MQPFNLEDRTKFFAKEVITICNKVNKNTVNYKIVDQLIRSACSIGSNYREANETDMKKDFRNKIRICKKETKETIYWLELLQFNNQKEYHIDDLIKECKELIKIFSAIFIKTK